MPGVWKKTLQYLGLVEDEDLEDLDEGMEPADMRAEPAPVRRLGRAERGLPDLGSRLGLLSTDAAAYGVWTDTRGGSVRTSKQDIARGVVAFNDPPRLSSGAEALLVIGGIALILGGIAVAVTTGTRRRRLAGAA